MAMAAAIMCDCCNAIIYDILFMECSVESCKKLYHLKCLELSTEAFEEQTQEYKANWKCPGCVCAIRKTNNANTPVRGGVILNETFTPKTCSFVNTVRGSNNQDDLSIIMDNEGKILQELREFRSEMMHRMDGQLRDFVSLHNKFTQTERELREMRQAISVVQEKADKVNLLEAEIQSLREKNQHLEGQLKIKDATSQPVESNQQPWLSMPKQNKTRVVRPKQQGGATKPASDGKADEILTDSSKQNNLQEPIVSITLDNIPQEAQGEWTTVSSKKKRYPTRTSEVMKGGMQPETTTDIQGTERKKYLHVWRLRKDTTVESLEKYVKNIYGKEVQIKVTKINHKTERDYASFTIGVPESNYKELCKPENWPVNIEYCEWIWFRRPLNQAGKS